MPFKSKACLHCGTQLTLVCRRDETRKKFCSHSCRMLWRYESNPWDMARVTSASKCSDKKPTRQKACEHCGRLYMPTSARQRWCPVCVPSQEARARMQRYRMSNVLFSNLLSSQGHKCAVCKSILSLTYVDHDHACCNGTVTCGRCIRGILCARCNMAIAALENPLWMQQAKEYLRMPPFRSRAQVRWMYANKPAMAKRWAKETPNMKRLPNRVKKKK